MSPARQVVSISTAWLVALFLSGCGGSGDGNDVDPFAPAASDAAPCDSYFIADMTGDFGGQWTAERALAAWLSGTETRTLATPPTIPVDGWSAERVDAEEERSFVSGDWRATARESVWGQWLITELVCVTPFDEVAAR